MKKTCFKCSKDLSSEASVKMNMNEGNLVTVKFICCGCTGKILNKIVPGGLADSLLQDSKKLLELLSADKSLKEKFLSTAAEIENQERLGQIDPSDNIRGMSFMEIKEYLDKYIIGQDEAKQALALAVGRMIDSEADEMIKKTNVLLAGPTATGKTDLCRVLAKALGVPFVVIDSSALTPAGYTGANVSTIFQRLFLNADKDMDRAERGIVMLDEIDKILGGAKKDFSVQSELLKVLEDGEYTFEEHKGKTHVINTRNILFIGAGAFTGIEKQMNAKNKGSISLSAPTGEKAKDVTVSNFTITPDDLIKYGMAKEFVGRFVHVATLHKLNEEQLYQVLTSKRGNFVEQYSRIFGARKLEFKPSEAFLRRIAHESAKSETGVRDLQRTMELEVRMHLFQGKSVLGDPRFPDTEEDSQTQAA